MRSYIFLIIIPICSIEVLGTKDYNKIASNLNMRVTNQLDQFLNLGSLVHDGLFDIVWSTFKIKEQNRIVQIQDALKKKKGHEGIENCEQLLEDKLAYLIHDVRSIVKENLTTISSKLRNIQSTLKDIQTKLNGTNLPEEINKCQESEETCKISRDYAISVDDAGNFLNDFGGILDTGDLLMTVFDWNRGIVSYKLENDVIVPVMDCQRSLT